MDKYTVIKDEKLEEPLPLADIPMMPDEKWMALCAEQKESWKIMSDYISQMETVSGMLDTSTNLLDYVLDDMDSTPEYIMSKLARIVTTLQVLGEQLKQIDTEHNDILQQMTRQRKER